MNKVFIEKFKESFFSVFPVAIIIIILNFFITPIPIYNYGLLLVSVLLLSIGIGLFTMGAEMSMITIGETISLKMIKTKKLWLIVLISFIMGLIITIAEPDLNVLAGQIPMVNMTTLILTVAIGVGIFLVISFLRILLQIELKYLLFGLYAIVFLLAAFVPNSFVAIAFDSGGVTTGPITVPFILSLGLGLSSISGSKRKEADTFGLVALCSIGPILAVLILGLLKNIDGVKYISESFIEYTSIGMILSAMKVEILGALKEVIIALSPIIIIFIIFQLFLLKLSKTKVMKIFVGFIYTFIGLVIFISSVNFGFMPIGYYLGEVLSKEMGISIVVLIGMVIGFFIIFAEPAVLVLKNQVEEVTNGMITGKVIEYSLGIGVAMSIALTFLRIFFKWPIWYIILPGYIIALVLMFFVNSIFTAIAFDAGGVASGPMTATFLLPLAIGFCSGLGGDVVKDAFGLVAMVAMTPLITIQLLGVIYRIKTKHKTKHKTKEKIKEKIKDNNINVNTNQNDNNDEIIEYNEGSIE